MADIIIFGAGKAAQMMRAYVEKDGPDRVVGFTADQEYVASNSFDGLPLVAWEALGERFAPGEVELLGPISYARLNQLRRERHREAVSRGYRLASFIHPATHLYTEAIGEGCIILEGTVLQAYARIGDGVIICSSGVVGHHVVIGDYCFLSAQVGLSGGVDLGEECYLSGQTGVAQNLVIGARSALLNAAGVTRNLPPDSTVRGPGQRVMKIPSSRLYRILQG